MGKVRYAFYPFPSFLFPPFVSQEGARRLEYCRSSPAGVGKERRRNDREIV